MIIGYRLTDGSATSDDIWCLAHRPMPSTGQQLVEESQDTEVDCPWHCATCEALIAQRLTDDGKSYVWEGVTEFLLHDAGRGCIVAQWWLEWGDEVKDHLFHHDTQPVTELALTYVDECIQRQPTRDRYSPST